MAAAAHAEQHAVRRREAQRRLHVVLAEAARDQRRPAVDTAVPDLARLVVRRVRRAHHVAAQARRERVDVGLAALPGIRVQRKVSQ